MMSVITSEPRWNGRIKSMWRQGCIYPAGCIVRGTISILVREVIGCLTSSKNQNHTFIRRHVQRRYMRMGGFWIVRNSSMLHVQQRRSVWHYIALWVIDTAKWMDSYDLLGKQRIQRKNWHSFNKPWHWLNRLGMCGDKQTPWAF